MNLQVKSPPESETHKLLNTNPETQNIPKLPPSPPKSSTAVSTTEGIAPANLAAAR